MAKRMPPPPETEQFLPPLYPPQEPHKHQVEQIAEMCPNYSWFGT
jgi:hypothetical protein